MIDVSYLFGVSDGTPENRGHSLYLAIASEPDLSIGNTCEVCSTFGRGRFDQKNNALPYGLFTRLCVIFLIATRARTTVARLFESFPTKKEGKQLHL